MLNDDLKFENPMGLLHDEVLKPKAGEHLTKSVKFSISWTKLKLKSIRFTGTIQQNILVELIVMNPKRTSEKSNL